MQGFTGCGTDFLDDYIGQKHLVGEGAVLRAAESVYCPCIGKESQAAAL